MPHLYNILRAKQNGGHCAIILLNSYRSSWQDLFHTILCYSPHLFSWQELISYCIVLLISPVFVTRATSHCIFIHLTALHDNSWFHNVFCYSPHRTSWQALLSCRIVLLTSPLFVTRADFTHSPQWIMATFVSRSPNTTKMTFDIIYIYICNDIHVFIIHSIQLRIA